MLLTPVIFPCTHGLISNSRQHPFSVGFNLLIAEAQHANALGLKEGLALGVKSCPFWFQMYAAIHLHAQTACHTIEVQNESLVGVLPAELEPVELAILQTLPEVVFRRCRLTPLLACGSHDRSTGMSAAVLVQTTLRQIWQRLATCLDRSPAC